jgi:hypothetical protein
MRNIKTKHILLLVLLIVIIIGASLSKAQDVVLYRTEFQTVQGNDGLWYIQCLAGCDEFYNIAPIDVLYTPQPTDWQAMNEFKRLEASYLGLGYAPLPAPRE